jgi:BMFP domain-containing protein YqiC
MTHCIDISNALRYTTGRKEVKRMAAKTARVGGWTTAMPKGLSKLGETARKRMRKQWNESIEMLPPVPRKALKRLTANVDRARDDLRKSGDRLVAGARKRAERLADEAQKRLESTIGPLMNRFDVASRKDVDRLQRRLHELERRIHSEHRPTSSPV